jgi:hypothetical protein
MIHTRQPISFESALHKLPAGSRIDAQFLDQDGACPRQLSRLEALCALQGASEIYAIRAEPRVQAIALEHAGGWLVMQAAA